MLTRRVIACLDVRAGRVVKGVRFESLRDVGDPAERAAAYEEQGADEIVMLDVSATLEERLAALRSVERIRDRLRVPLTVGGGVRDVEDARRLLSNGADRVCVNSAAVRRPELIAELSERFGAQCVVLAVDAARRGETGGAGARGWRVAIRSGTFPVEIALELWAARGEALGAGEVLLTSIDRDGTGAGYDLELVRAVCEAVSIPVVASGGAKTPGDLAAALDAGADAVLIASMIHDGGWTVDGVKKELAQRGARVRPTWENAP